MEPTVFGDTKKDGLIAGGKKIDLGVDGEGYLADRYAQFQRFPVIYKSQGKYGIVYSDTVVGRTEYDSLVYVKGNVPRQGEVHFYLAGKKQEDGKLKFGLISKEGEVVFPFVYDELIPNLKEIAQIENEKTVRHGLFGDSCKEFSAWDLGWNTDLSGNYFSALINGKWGIITLEGETILPFEYDQIFNTFNFDIIGE
ncbi:MAG: WG repeat-containing protein [Flavobacteriales bacterium]